MTLAKASMAMFSEGRTSLCAFGRWGLVAMVGTQGGVQGVKKDPNSKRETSVRPVVRRFVRTDPCFKLKMCDGGRALIIPPPVQNAPKKSFTWRLY